MDSPDSRVEAVRQAVTSTSSCTAATVAILKDLILYKEPETSTAGSGSQTQAIKGSKARPKAITTSAKTKTTITKAHGDGRRELSEKEKAGLATQVLNAGLRSLCDASKQHSAVP